VIAGSTELARYDLFLSRHHVGTPPAHRTAATLGEEEDMERNDFAGDSSTTSGGSSAGGGFGSTGSTNSTGTTSGMGSTSGSQSAGASSSGDSVADRARDVAGQAQEKLAGAGSTVRDKAGNLKDSLVGALETGADKLRKSGGQGGQLAGATGTGSSAIATDGNLAAVSDRVAGGMQSTADWLRDADIDGLKSGLERQVKEHPGRTLLMAAGLGYLLGKAFRK
jgi:hypothetical protein